MTGLRNWLSIRTAIVKSQLLALGIAAFAGWNAVLFPPPSEEKLAVGLVAGVWAVEAVLVLAIAVRRYRSAAVRGRAGMAIIVLALACSAVAWAVRRAALSSVNAGSIVVLASGSGMIWSLACLLLLIERSDRSSWPKPGGGQGNGADGGPACETQT